MFGGSRRQRPPVQPLTKETANPNAATAAASAFMRREPSTSLSSAAAAAALKARPTTPTNVAEVQSKRTLRRSGSVSSTRSQDKQNGKQQLHRSPSTGSMTERTFRSPSPGRSPVPTSHDVPPVPSLPKNDPQRPSSTHAASGSIQTQPFRTASQKAKGGQQGSWFGGATARDTSNIRTTDLVLHSPDPNDARSGSISPSINFSYPRARMESPAPSGTSPEVVMVYDPNSRRMVPKIDALEKQYAVQQASEKPAKKKKKKQQPKTGSHLAQGTMDRTKVGSAGGSPHSTTRTSQPVQPQSLQKAAAVKSAHTNNSVERPVSESLPKQTVVEPNTSTSEPTKLDLRVADGATVMPAPGSPRSATLGHLPVAMVEKEEEDNDVDEREDDEEEEEDGDGPTQEAALQQGEVAVKDHAIITTESPAPSKQVVVPTKELVAPTLVEQRLPPHEVRRARVESQSPARSPGRSAHFAPTADQLLVRHEPPPRSLSPRKSALKNASSVRGASPSDDGSEASGSVAGSFSREDSLQARKKAARVSFNDENTVVGESAEPPDTDSPIVPSPQSTKKPWHGVITRYQKREMPLVDDEETMSPRPALPLFGSVREKKQREPDSERPLVRPSDRTWSPPQSPILAENDASEPSSDAAIGAALVQEQASRNAANISKTREPLPPVVQSIESTGYLSNSPLTSDDELDDSDTVDSSQLTDTNDVPCQIESSKVPALAIGIDEEGESSRSQTSQPADKTRDEAEVSTSQNSVTELQQAETEAVPSISITNPSPLPKEEVEVSPVSDYFDLPGGFPEDDSNGSTAMQPVSHDVSQPSPVSTLADVEPAIVLNSPMADIKEEEESTEGSSIYSDAYEDLSDVDGDGFMSLDAVLTSPAESKTAKIFEKTVTQAQKQVAEDWQSPVAEEKEVAPRTSQDWENAKAYWRSLSADKRRQLETEAMEEAAEDADQEASPKPKKKTKKKRKSADRDALLNAAQRSGEAEAPFATGNAKQADPAIKLFRKSMRGTQPERLDQATSQAGTMRQSLRTNGSTRDGDKTLRPSSFHPGSNTEATISKKRPVSSDGRPTSSGGLASTGMKPSLRRRGSDSSESSFKRSRVGAGDGFGFRRTMRSSVQDSESQEPTKGSGRFSLRSLSPTGSAFRRSSFTSSPTAGGRSMKQSLRGDSNDTKSKRISTFGRSSGKKAKGRLGSRFADSSDDDTVFPSSFRSRFADSSDDEGGVAQAPKSQGMAKSMRTSKGANSAAAAALGVQPAQFRAESPDLYGQEEVISQPKRNSTVNGSGRPPIQRNRSGRGEFPVSSPGVVGTEGLGNRPSHSRRGSFMSSILRRKKDTGNKISRDLSESAVRRDTKLERSTEELTMLRSNSGNHPRLHKREPSWPLPEEQDADEMPAVNGNAEKRPATSSGAASAPRGFLKRRSLSHQDVPPVPPIEPAERAETPSEATTTTGKKKKFGTLRRMFRIND